MSMSKECQAIQDKLIGLIKQYNEALKAKNLDAMTTIEASVKDTEAEFALQSQNDLFMECKKADNPILEGVKRYTYPVLKHKIANDGTGMSLVDDREKQIDLVKLCKYCTLPTAWAYTVEAAGELLCIRTAKELGMTTEEIKMISNTYRMDKKAKEVELGGTPTSNNQICKLLQKVLDEILFEDDGSGKNRYKCNSHDVAYLLACYTRRGRKQLCVTVAKNSFLNGLIVDVMHRITCGLKYGIEYAMVRESNETPKVAKPEEPAKPAPEVEGDTNAAEGEETETVVLPRPEQNEEVA